MSGTVPIRFSDVNKVLSTIIANWTTGNGAPPDLLGEHGATFLLDTADHLKNASARGIRLIQPEIIGKAGQGKTANIVLALTTGVGGFPKMPDGGLDSTNNVFLTPDSPQIQTLVAWIEGGCLP